MKQHRCCRGIPPLLTQPQTLRVIVPVTRAPDTTPADTTAPVITLNGESKVTVILNQTYTEQNATATDHQDGVMWQDDENARTIRRVWQSAIDYCTNLSFAGYENWALPERDRLLSIVDTVNVPTIESAFTNRVSGCYWSSTAVADDESCVGRLLRRWRRRLEH